MHLVPSAAIPSASCSRTYVYPLANPYLRSITGCGVRLGPGLFHHSQTRSRSIKALSDYPYTPDVVELICRHWPEITSARESGTMSIEISTLQSVNFNSRVAGEELRAMTPRANRRSNTTYSIDNLASIACDVEGAMLKALDEKARHRLSMIMLEGYTQDEVAEMEGVGKAAISRHLDRAFEKMSEYLESPKEPKVEVPYTYETPTHHRKYQNLMYNAPNR